MSDPSDPTIERIEAELRESRFRPWDAETFLANRHQAKIDALRAAESKWALRWQMAKEMFWAIMGFIGWITTVSFLGLWLLLGTVPNIRADRTISNELMQEMYPDSFNPRAQEYLERDFEAGANFICDEIELHYQRDICAEPEVNWRR